jgi:hypothetical protein
MSAIRTEVFQSFGWGPQGFSLIDEEEGLAGLGWRVTDHATFRLMRSKAPHPRNREETKARRKWRFHRADSRYESRVYLEESAGAVDLKLSDDVARLEAALRPEAVSGSRYNEKVMAGVDR